MKRNEKDCEFCCVSLVMCKCHIIIFYVCKSVSFTTNMDLAIRLDEVLKKQQRCAQRVYASDPAPTREPITYRMST